jgi:hypothetical protein
MNSCNDQKATLLKAAQQANVIGSYILSFPNDRSVIQPLREAASTIDTAARALGHQELIDLSTNLVYTANGTISTARRLEKLTRIVGQILTIAESSAEHS